MHKRMMRKILLLAVTLFLILSLGYLLTQKHTSPQASVTAGNNSVIRYLPLGDSYTIGQSVPEDQRWPNQLVVKLKASNVDMTIVANPAVTGYTTKNLIQQELPLLEKHKPQFVSILIGVNDYVQGVSVATTTKNLQQILDTVQKSVSRDKIVIVTIPDYSKTPAGARFGDPAASSLAIKNLNDIILYEAKKRNILAVDIYAISQQVANDPELIAGDGLHPSGKQYTLWTDAIYQAMSEQKIFTK